MMLIQRNYDLIFDSPGKIGCFTIEVDCGDEAMIFQRAEDLSLALSSCGANELCITA
jgi:hypothetical protein